MPWPHWCLAAAAAWAAAFASASTRLLARAASLELLANGAVSVSGGHERGRTDAVAPVESGGDDLLAWAATHSRVASAAAPPPIKCTDCFLVIGVKVSALRGFRERQAVRETWGDARRLAGLATRVVFLGCSVANATQQTTDALQLEKREYGDLLTDELCGCVDSYVHLVDKTLAFLAWTAEHHASAAYVMVADDDVYVRVDVLVAMLRDAATPRRRYYAGQVWAVQLRRAISPIRDPAHKNHLSAATYPMAQLAPFAVGPHYVVSADVARFLARNRPSLRGVGSLEDVSVAFWLLALLQLQPTHLPFFRNLRTSACHNALMSYGDLSRLAIREIHANVLDGGAGFCRGFSFSSWLKTASAARDLSALRRRPLTRVIYEWRISLDVATRTASIDVAIESHGVALPRMRFTPATQMYEAFCIDLHTTAASVDLLIPPTLCTDHLAQLDGFLSEQPPSNAALVALARSNLPPFAVADAVVTVWIARAALRHRLIVECLVAEVFRDVHVYVVDEATAPMSAVEPDIVVTDADSLAWLESLPVGSRVLVFAGGREEASRVVETRMSLHQSNAVIVLTPDPAAFPTLTFSPQQQQQRRRVRVLHVPPPALAFSQSVAHSPTELLASSNVRFMAAADPRPLANARFAFAGRRCGRAVAVVAALLDVEPPVCDDTSAGDEADVAAPFSLDGRVDQFKAVDFVLAFDCVEAVVAAFLAGSVPVFHGNGSTSGLALFNAAAFIHCDGVASIRACAQHVNAVARSPPRYAAMRAQPPIVDDAAFALAFSWHPAVLAHVRPPRKRLSESVEMAQTLRELLNSV